MEFLLEPAAWISFLTLCSLELVLGIDNVIFISILASKLPLAQQAKARTVGLSLAVITRILLLLSLSWLVSLTEPFFEIFGKGFSGRDLILLIGGIFLLAKSTHEIHAKIEHEPTSSTEIKRASFRSVIIQILALDIVFSIDSVITAVGMVDQVIIMVAAVLVSTGVMIAAAGKVSAFVDRNPTIKMLALSFLLLIGCALVADGLGHHIPKGYIYFSMAFSVFVEMLNLKMWKVAPAKS